MSNINYSRKNRPRGVQSPPRNQKETWLLTIIQNNGVGEKGITYDLDECKERLNELRVNKARRAHADEWALMKKKAKKPDEYFTDYSWLFNREGIA